MARSILPFLALVCTCHGLFDIIGNKQSVTVTGKLICDGEPADGILVKLYEDGTIFDSKLGSVKTGSDGTFILTGTYEKILTMDPKVNIYHSCNYEGPCSKKIEINIPSDAVSSGSSTEDSYDIGTINLADKFSGETTDCIH